MFGKIEQRRSNQPFLLPKTKERISDRPAHNEWMTTKLPLCKCCGNKDLKYSGKKEGFKLWRCDHCEFVFTDIKPASHRKKDLSREEKNAKTIEFLSPALTWLPPSKLKILDFGCGESNIPKRLRKVGHRVIEVDIIPPKKSHRDRLTGSILDLDIPQHSFDLIYSYNVFEYIANPLPILSRLCRLIKEDGLLLINTDMEAADKVTDDVLTKPASCCSYYSHLTFEKMLNKMDYNIIYKNPNMIIARQE
jgi:SAM-dependent methyltransferase